MSNPIAYPEPTDNPHCKCKGNPMASMFCQFGHMSECHFPRKCSDAGCSHLFSYDLEIDDANRLIDVSRRLLEMGHLPPYSLSLDGHIQIDPDPRSMMRKYKTARPIKSEILRVQDLFGKNGIEAGEIVYLLENTGNGLIVQTEDKRSAFVQMEDLLLTEPTNFIVIFRGKVDVEYVFLEALTSEAAAPSLAVELMGRQCPDFGFSTDDIIAIREWYFDLPGTKHQTDEVKGTYRVNRNIMSEYTHVVPDEQDLVIAAGTEVNEIERDGDDVMVETLDKKIVTTVPADALDTIGDHAYESDDRGPEYWRTNQTDQYIDLHRDDELE